MSIGGTEFIREIGGGKNDENDKLMGNVLNGREIYVGYVNEVYLTYIGHVEE